MQKQLTTYIDGITPIIFKAFAINWAIKWANTLFNKIFEQSIDYPNEWTVGIIKPLF